MTHVCPTVDNDDPVSVEQEDGQFVCSQCRVELGETREEAARGLADHSVPKKWKDY